MAQLANFENINYISSVEAGKQFGYTNDYVARLAREKKILATRVGRQWFVEAQSVESFIKKTDNAKKVHAVSVRNERLLERADYDAGCAPLKALPLLIPRVATLAKTGIVLCSSFVAVAFLFSQFNQASSPDFSLATASGALKTIALRANSLVSLARMDSHAPAQVVTAVSKETPPEQEEKKRDAFVVVPDGEPMSDAEIRKSLSDEIEVVREEDGTSGAIVPKFKNSSSTPYRFLLVPMKPP